MDNLNLVKTGTDLLTIDGVRSAVEGIASSPKVAAGVAAATTSMGAMATLDMIQSGLGLVSLLIGTITGCVVLAIQSIKLVRVYRYWNPNRPEPKGDV